MRCANTTREAALTGRRARATLHGKQPRERSVGAHLERGMTIAVVATLWFPGEER
jgi:hypothetical protein